jgi:hypothetical protein
MDLSLKGLFALGSLERKELERQAFALGSQLYGDSPKVFTSRHEAYWAARRLPRSPVAA